MGEARVPSANHGLPSVTIGVGLQGLTGPDTVSGQVLLITVAEQQVHPPDELSCF